jgi:hypothetical protein
MTAAAMPVLSIGAAGKRISPGRAGHPLGMAMSNHRNLMEQTDALFGIRENQVPAVRSMLPLGPMQH